MKKKSRSLWFTLRPSALALLAAPLVIIKQKVAAGNSESRCKSCPSSAYLPKCSLIKVPKCFVFPLHPGYKNEADCFRDARQPEVKGGLGVFLIQNIKNQRLNPINGNACKEPAGSWGQRGLGGDFFFSLGGFHFKDSEGI